MESGEASPGFNISSLAEKVRNVDGRMIGKDGKPMLPRRNVLFNTSKLGGPKVDIVDTNAGPEMVDKVDTGSSVENSDGNGNTVKTNEVTEGDMLKPAGTESKKSYAAALSPEKLATPSSASVDGLNKRQVNFRLLEADQPSDDSADVLIPLSSVVEANARFEFTLYGYFLGKRVAFPVVEQYVKNTWRKYGLTSVMMNAKGFFFFKFSSATGMEGVLENGPWSIRSVPIILKKWTANVTLAKEDLASVPIWVKFHDVPIAAFTADGLSVMASKLGTPIMLDSYTSAMCMSSWGRLDFARALIDVSADRVPKDSLVIAIPSEKSKDVTLHTVKVEFEWKPPRCNTCMVFGHTNDHCPKCKKPEVQTKDGQKVGADLNNQTGAHQPKPFRGLVVGNQKKVTVGKTKKVYVPKYQNKEASKTSTSNSFEALNKINSNVDKSASASKMLDKQVEDKQMEDEEGNPVAVLEKNQGTTTTGDLQKEDRGKNVETSSCSGKGGDYSSLYTQWKGSYGPENADYDSDEVEVYDDYANEMASFMDAFDRRKR